MRAGDVLCKREQVPFHRRLHSPPISARCGRGRTAEDLVRALIDIVASGSRTTLLDDDGNGQRKLAALSNGNQPRREAAKMAPMKAGRDQPLRKPIVTPRRTACTCRLGRHCLVRRSAAPGSVAGTFAVFACLPTVPSTTARLLELAAGHAIGSSGTMELIGTLPSLAILARPTAAQPIPLPAEHARDAQP